MEEFYIDIGKRIMGYRKEKKFTLEQLGDLIGVGKSTVRKYENGMIRITHDRMLDISNALGIDVSLLYGESIEKEIVNVPLYGNIACGDGNIIFDTAEDTFKTPKNWVDEGIYFYLRAKGDSMIGAKIHEGDLLLIKQQEIVENGEIAAVAIDDDCVLKRVYRDNNSLTLISENPNYEPIRFNPNTEKSIMIIGKLVKSITEF